MHCTTSPPKSSTIDKNVDLLAEFDRELAEIKRYRQRDGQRDGQQIHQRYGRDYLQLSTALWYSRYDGDQMHQALVWLDQKKQLNSRESQICWLLHAWGVDQANQSNMATIASATQISRRGIIRILKRLGHARIVVNLGSDRRQHFAMNPLFESWEIKTLFELRDDNTQAIQNRMGQTDLKR